MKTFRLKFQRICYRQTEYCSRSLHLTRRSTGSLTLPVNSAFGIQKVIIMRNIDRQKMKRDLFVAQLNSYLSFRFEELREYFNSVQHLFKSEEKRISHWMHTQTATLSPEEKDQFYEWYGENHSKFKESFPDIQRNSIFITIYAELEDVLKFICGALASKKGSFIQACQWRGGILERVKACLEKDIGIVFSPRVSLWDEVVKIRAIRNTIVHNGSWLDGKKVTDDKKNPDIEIIDYISNRKQSLMLLKSNNTDDFYKIQLTDSFVSEVLDTFDQLLKELLTLISEWVEKT